MDAEETATEQEDTDHQRSETVTKDRFLDLLASGKGYTKGVAKQVLDDTLALITDLVADGHKVQLTGFGSFEGQERSYVIPPPGKLKTTKKVESGQEESGPRHVVKTRPKFSAGRTFVDRLNADAAAGRKRGGKAGSDQEDHA